MHLVQLAKLRSSSQDLRTEKGRYNRTSQSIKSDEACQFCYDIDFLRMLEVQLPLFEDPVIKSENHVLTEYRAIATYDLNFLPISRAL